MVEMERFLKSSQILKIHNPFESRELHGCRFRLVVNTYKGCQYKCLYCYTYSYTMHPDILVPKCKVNFKARLDEDIEKYQESGLPKRLVYVSSNCEPFQPKLEDEHKHSLYALQRLGEAGFRTIVMTKNPGRLLEQPYREAIDRSRTIVHVTIPFLDSRFEPSAPPPQDRLQAVHELVKSGFKVVVRVDPRIPVCNGIAGQTSDELSSLFEQLHSDGVTDIVSKCLRLSIGIKKLYPDFYERLKPYYVANGFRESRSVYVLNPDAKRQLLAPVYESCNRYRMRLWTCMDDVGFAGTAICDGSEEILKEMRG